MFWDFLSLHPESTHQVTILMSDRGTPRSYRHMNGYSSHTFKWTNAEGRFVWVKLHFKSESGIQNLTHEEAQRLCGVDADHATRDLFQHLANGGEAAWRVCVQIMKPEEAARYRFHPFDVTKVWPHKDYPLQPLGRMVLQRNPDNYFAEVEQAAFSPGHLVPGIEPSPDKMLQGRLFSYPDTHRHRLGANYQQLPINCPFATRGGVRNYQRDGPAAIGDNGGSGPNYGPNSADGPIARPDTRIVAFDTIGVAGRYRYQHPNDDYEQPGNLYRLMSPDQKSRLIGNIVGHLGRARKDIQLRQAVHFYRADPDYGTRVASGLGLDLAQLHAAAQNNSGRHPLSQAAAKL